jgi:hypothetical protein
MAAITHLYDVNQTVWYLNPLTGVKECIILKIDITKTLSSTIIKYKLKVVDDNSQIESLEMDLYSTLSGVGSALEAYETLLVG